MDGKKDEQDVDDDSTDDSGSEMPEDESIDEETSSGANVTDDSEDETEDSEEHTPTQKNVCTRQFHLSFILVAIMFDLIYSLFIILQPEVVGKKRVSETMTPSGKKAKAEPSGQRTGALLSFCVLEALVMKM